MCSPFGRGTISFAHTLRHLDPLAIPKRLKSGCFGNVLATDNHCNKESDRNHLRLTLHKTETCKITTQEFLNSTTIYRLKIVKHRFFSGVHLLPWSPGHSLQHHLGPVRDAAVQGPSRTLESESACQHAKLGMPWLRAHGLQGVRGERDQGKARLMEPGDRGTHREEVILVFLQGTMTAT